MGSGDRRNGDRSRRERGAALVEVAIAAPILLTLLVGMAEIAFIVNTSQIAVAGSQSAARAVSSGADSRLADYDGLAALSGALVDVESQIEYLVVFKPTATGEMPTTCASTSVAGTCNHYSASDMGLAASAFAGTTSCSGGTPDAAWCPLDRSTSQASGLDWIGVMVVIRHESIAAFIPDRMIAESTVMQVEPRFQP